jgi:hypothetical protein
MDGAWHITRHHVRGRMVLLIALTPTANRRGGSRRRAC